MRATAGLLLAIVLAGLLLGPGAAARPAAAGSPGAAPAHASVLRPSAPGPSNSSFDGSWSTYRDSVSRSGFTDQVGPRSDQIAWEVQLSTQPGLHLRSSPVVNGSLIVIADDFGDVYGLNASANGSEIWEAQIGPVATSPSLWKDLVIYGDGDGGVVALVAATGAEKWSRGLGSPIVQAVLVVDGILIVATEAPAVYALNASNGDQLWSRPLASYPAGAPAFDGTYVDVSEADGALVGLSPVTGAVDWNANVGGSLATGPAAADGRVFVDTVGGRIVAVDPNGSIAWSFSTAGLGGSAPFHAPPAVDGALLYATDDGGGTYALWAGNGTLRWNTTTPFPFSDGYNDTVAPVVTPSSLYYFDALGRLDDADPSNGTLRWSLSILVGNVGISGDNTVYCSPAVTDGALLIGDDADILTQFGGPGLLPRYPVTGRVVNGSGAPIANASVDFGLAGTVTTAANGSYAIALSNGTWAAVATAPRYDPGFGNVTVLGGPAELSFALELTPLYPVLGRVVDGGSYLGLAGVRLALFGPNDISSNSTTGPGGAFVLEGPAGTDFITVRPPAGYRGLEGRYRIAAGPTDLGSLALSPLAIDASPPAAPLDVLGDLLPGAALAAGALVLGFASLAERRRLRGLPGQVLSPFGRRVAMRVVLFAVQVVALLAILYTFGTVLPAAGTTSSACSISVDGCVAPSACSWSLPDLPCVFASFFDGFGHFLGNMLTLNWGIASFGNLREPVQQFIGWWLAPSLELALFSLALALLVAYPVGLWAGWRPDGVFDTGVRLGSILALLVPTFVFLLLALGSLYTPFTSAFGDSPYGTTPTLEWMVDHGGVPGWIGLAGQTQPTGLPLLDAAYHGDWAFAAVVLVKTLLQATFIAFVYVAIFLRYARHAVVERARSLPILAARARGVPERTLLWRHAAAEVLPVYVLLLGITLPIYIGTQAVTEALFNDIGIGRVLIAEMTQVARTGFGIATSGGALQGNLYQVMIFLLLLVVLAGSLISDIVAQYLDPRLQKEGR